MMENADVLEGVSIAEGTIRKYNDSIYFSQIIGYTGKIDQEELKVLQEENDAYDLNDTVGKSGIEASMETELQGMKGSETVYVDNLGKVIKTSDRTEPTAGNDIYLTIDSDLQRIGYHILESKLAAILLDKIENIKEFHVPEGGSGGKIQIPIYDVYFACINNNIIDTAHFKSDHAGETEALVYEIYQDKKSRVFATLREEMEETCTAYENLTEEYQNYESYIVSMLYNQNIIMSEAIDREDERRSDQS